MALTRKMLSAMGIESERIDQIIESHTEVVEGWKTKVSEAQASIEELREQAKRVPTLEKKVEELEAAIPTEDWQAKYGELEKAKDELQGEYDAYKEKVAQDASDAEKRALYTKLLREVGLDEKRAEKAARLKSLDELTVENGKLAGYDELKASEAEEWAEFIPQTSVRGQNVETPPKTEPVGEQPNERAVKIAKERHEKLYGKSEE